LEKPVCKSRFSVINMGDNTKIADIFHGS